MEIASRTVIRDTRLRMNLMGGMTRRGRKGPIDAAQSMKGFLVIMLGIDVITKEFNKWGEMNARQSGGQCRFQCTNHTFYDRYTGTR